MLRATVYLPGLYVFTMVTLDVVVVTTTAILLLLLAYLTRDRMSWYMPYDTRWTPDVFRCKWWGGAERILSTHSVPKRFTYPLHSSNVKLLALSVKFAMVTFHVLDVPAVLSLSLNLDIPWRVRWSLWTTPRFLPDLRGACTWRCGPAAGASSRELAVVQNVPV